MPSQPWIHVDWSCICSVTKMYLLRAYLSMHGRSIVIYEESHPKEKENNHTVHKAFLNRLKAILEPSIKPVIVTDAGFRAPWFSYIQELVWNFVGRLRKNLIKLKCCSVWILSNTLYTNATASPNYLGEGLLTETHKVLAHFVLYKGVPKKRLYKARSRRGGTAQKPHVNASKEPWLLVTSINNSEIGKQSVNIYRQRMRIEENFRDTKCTRYGFGLKESRSRSVGRMNILLLVAAIATFACWLSGIFTRENGNASGFQAQSAKNKGILSIVYLGREAIKEGLKITRKQFEKTLKCLSAIHAAAQMEAACYE